MGRATQFARQAWLALYKGVRAANLYAPDHTEVHRWANTLAAQMDAACAVRPVLVLEFKPHTVHLDSRMLHDTQAEREMLVERLHADGVRNLQFTAEFDVESAMRLLQALAPYCYSDRAPLQPVSDRLHWEQFPGVSVQVQHRTGAPGGLAVDVLTNREREWMARVQRGPSVTPEELPLEAMRAVWDGTSGIVPWPATVPVDEAERLDQEVQAIGAQRVTAARVAELLLLAVQHWGDDDRLEQILEPLTERIRSLVDSRRPGDAGRLLGPLLSWSHHSSDDPFAASARGRVRALVPLLLEDDRLRVLLESARTRAVAPGELTAYFEALPPDRLHRVVEFASVLPDGPHRDALIRLVATKGEQDPGALRRAILQGPAGIALVGIAAIEAARPTRESVAIILEALERTEAPVVCRAIRYLLPLRSRRIAERLLPFVRAEMVEVRSAALAYMARYAYRPAFVPIRDFTQSGYFQHLDLAQRCELCRTLGVVGGREAEKLAWTHLPAGFERLEPDRSVPWIVCLAAAGATDAGEYLDAMDGSSDAAIRAVSSKARPMWARRIAARDEPTPSIQTMPGSPVPSAPGFERPRPSSGRHRAPSGIYRVPDEEDL